jgi:hypothetical protein
MSGIDLFANSNKIDTMEHMDLLLALLAGKVYHTQSDGLLLTIKYLLSSVKCATMFIR